MSDEGVLAAARAVRRFLPELVGPEAGAVDAEIAALLAERPWSAPQLRELMERREGTAAFLDAVLDDEPHYRPPTHRAAVRSFDSSGLPGYSGLPGEGGYGGAPLYRCPEGDYDWWQLADEDPLLCPTHGCALVRA